MTNPTLERAARAAAKADATLHNGPDLYEKNPELYLRLTCAVLMAVLPDADKSGEAAYRFIQAILNDGEGE